MDEAAHVAAAPVEIQQHIADPLARPVIGVAAAAARLVDRKSLAVEQLCRGGRYTYHGPGRSEEHTSELQSQSKLVCRLPLEKKKPSFGFSTGTFYSSTTTTYALSS